jgi:pyruvate dehydrogenase E2 component (dihydrolipoamide acetyltransferase)
LRQAIKNKNADAKVSYNDILLASVGRALRDCPNVNASWNNDSIIEHSRVDIGVAVALEAGLITPVIRNADQKSFYEIAEEIRSLSDKAKLGALKPEEYTGATFTISNLGMMKIDQFTAIINPPEAAILAVGAIGEVPLSSNGEIQSGWRMNVTMTCDHRVIDGAVGAHFLQVLRNYCENPFTLLI